MRKKEQFDIPIEEAMYIIKAPCWKCGEEMNVAVIRGDADKRDGSTVGPESFSEEEIEMAENNGTLIKIHYSGTREEKYKANTCPNCGAFVGSFYLFTDYFSPAEMGTYQYKRLILKSI